MYGKMQASGLTEFIPFLFTSAIYGQSCFLVQLASCIPLAPQQSPWVVAASPGWKFWEPSFTFGGQKSRMAVTFLVYQYWQEIFSFHSPICLSLPFSLHLHRTNDCSFSVSSFHPLHLILPPMAPSHFYISHAGAPVLSHLH